MALIPILRSGLGLVDAMLELLPTASVHHIGMYKVLGSNPVQYYNRLPRECKADVAYVLDPVIRTSSTIMSVIGILKKVRGCLCVRLQLPFGCLFFSNFLACFVGILIALFVCVVYVYAYYGE